MKKTLILRGYLQKKKCKGVGKKECGLRKNVEKIPIKINILGETLYKMSRIRLHLASFLTNTNPFNFLREIFYSK